MQKLLWAECQKMRRSKIIFIAVFATIMIAFIIFIEGWVKQNGIRDIDGAGWYMTMAQPMATFFVFPR